MSSERFLRHQLISYLREKKNKSYRSFLLHYRKEISEYFLHTSVMSWRDHDNTWSQFFLLEAKRLLNENNFDTLEYKVRVERCNDGLKNYWEEIIQECEKKQELISYESERDRLLHLLSEVNEKINITKAELTRFSSLGNNSDLISDNGSEIQSGIGGDLYEDINGDPSGDTEMNTEDSISSDNDSSRKKNRRNLVRVNYNCGSPPRKRRKTRPASRRSTPRQSPCTSLPSTPTDPSHTDFPDDENLRCTNCPVHCPNSS
ncbi:hypothetical protein GLOIN_2v1487390 [Rhizophagus irregularis DAOM 181602=DAOM 197198]|uniref:Uncharacterized protein n=2 Tax=Rhizophagus irregularis TaxID=588596 RepID=A0A015ISZ9_RHIIW|nr:hypothetical protein GLOIN_2v1487390 [Rhizophagus irregularis DAOM 181602=DAOM 197198]EXX60352.1 hypothetical protein RirG_180670 [Rhizophagus irregularis DAOM 197198w]POG59975.1 hypothetical protein GLOIN_2v1487390 [Rhizophagus irregularis DAOM 181602=DAOM 197198]|eukprot:XP_025166841.1 hypothetical protein GLOIN_2v1487390 [Rhizophagus irregularis DAOM 181602=DAOM 197198]